MSADRFARLAARIVAGEISLVPLAREHERELILAFADADLWTWMLVRPALDAASVRAWVDDALARAAARDHAPFVVVGADGSLLGTTRFLGIRDGDAALEIGWTMIFANARGGATNSRMKLAMLERAFASGFERVELRTDARNARSRAAIAAIGGTYEGTLRAYQRRFDGTSRDTAMFSVLASEWPRVRAKLGARIEARRTLRTVVREKSATTRSTDFDWHGDAIAVTTPVTADYRSTQNVRRFLLDRCGPAFRFDRDFMAWIRDGREKTMGDVAAEWLRRSGSNTAQEARPAVRRTKAT